MLHMQRLLMSSKIKGSVTRADNREIKIRATGVLRPKPQPNGAK
jgi:hypothetical protein